MVLAPYFRFELREASPILLQGGDLPRTDANSPVHHYAGQVFAFMSHYTPLGHTYRRVGKSISQLTGPLERVRLLDDPDPTVGKWIESTWRAPSGRLYGWYHAEEAAPCARRIFIPHIGALVSDSDGASWRFLGEILRSPSSLMDCNYQNGFLAGGYGDCCVIADPAQTYLYVFFSSYVSAETAQGVAVARYKIVDCDRPARPIELWRDGAWHPPDHLPTPIYQAVLGWKNPDPDAFWGPAVHFNRNIDAYVMLLNHTQNGHGNIIQEGIYVSFNRHLDDPSGWTSPVCMVKGGVWYPQVIGVGRDESDTIAGASARFFMSGFSAWTIEFSRVADGTAPSLPTFIGLDEWARMFGPTTPSRLGIG